MHSHRGHAVRTSASERPRALVTGERFSAAEELALGRWVALKVLTEQSLGVSGDSFQRGIRTVAKLHHPHIVTRPIGEAVALARDVADALAHAHRQGVIHGD